MIVRHSGRWCAFPLSLVLSDIISTNGSPVYYSAAVRFQTDPCCPNHGKPPALPGYFLLPHLNAIPLLSGCIYEPICTARLRRQTSAVLDWLLPPPASVPQSAWETHGTNSCLRASWGRGLVVNVRCCGNDWNQHGTGALFSCGTIRWKQHSGDWLTSWLILSRAVTVRKGNEPPLLFNTVFPHVEPLQRGSH